MNEITADKALLIVMAVGVFASGYYFHEYNALNLQNAGQSAYSTEYDSPNAMENDLTASAASSIDNINLSDDPFVNYEDISTEEPTLE